MLPPELQTVFAEFDIIDYKITHFADKKMEVHLVGYPASKTKDSWESEESAEIGDTMRHALRKAARELYEAAFALGTQKTKPATPRPRRKEIEVCPGFRWPSETRDEFQYVWALDPTGVRHLINSDSFLEVMIETNGARPRDVLRTVRRLQQAEKWCRARIQGRERAARNIMSMQTRTRKAYGRLEQEAYTELQAESVLDVLREEFN